MSISDGSRPNSVGVQTIPETRLVLATKSIIRQSLLFVARERLIPLPIYRKYLDDHQCGKAYPDVPFVQRDSSSELDGQ